MKNKLIFSVFLVSLMAFGLVFAGCSSTPKITDVFDESVPEDQRAILTIPGGYYDVFEFSGTAVKWFKLTLFGMTTVHIPSGEHTIKFRYYPGGDTKVSGSNIVSLKCNFEAGNHYQLTEKARYSSTTFLFYNLTTKQYIE